MAIPESQLETWSHRGSITQSAATYNTVRSALEAQGASYNEKSYGIFLQGSYGNHTNVYADSDVDVVIQLGSTFHHGIENLSESDKAAFNRTFSAASYSFQDFKRDVINQLTNQFGENVKSRNKAIFVKGSNSRRDADVVPATAYRRYTRFRDLSDQHYVEGIRFLTTDGTIIINFPKQHSENCTTKHQQTNQLFKPMVRILKNMRNSMIDNGVIDDDLAPSYFLEGMLYNVPNDCFGYNYSETYLSCMTWLRSADSSKLLCANEEYFLLHPTSPVTWRKESFESFLISAKSYWDNWT